MRGININGSGYVPALRSGQSPSTNVNGDLYVTPDQLAPSAFKDNWQTSWAAFGCFISSA